MYINANHKLVYHYLTYFAILQSVTWTVYGLQYVRFLSTHLKPATRGRIRFKIIWFFLFGLCLRHTLILWVSVNDLNYRGRLLTSTAVLQAIFSENNWPFDSMPERWRYVAWRVRVYDLGHISNVYVIAVSAKVCLVNLLSRWKFWNFRVAVNTKPSCKFCI